MAQIPSIQLSDGNSLPAIGLGTYPMTGDSAVREIGNALSIGYRLIDTAQLYKNELEVGQAFAASGLPRSEVKLQTKISGGVFGEDHAIGAISAALGRLKVDRIDMILIHWPSKTTSSFVEQWRGLIAMQQEGVATSIGVSNFNEEQLRLLIDQTGVTPAVNQVELHPLKPQLELRRVHEELGIITQAWSPLGKDKAPYDAPAVRRAAREHAVTGAQVILRWHQHIGTLPLPKSSDFTRQAQNLDTFAWSLTDEEVREITALGT